MNALRWGIVLILVYIGALALVFGPVWQLVAALLGGGR